jgi:N-acetylated-alpha-linked acidic dipeptidase
VQITTHEVLLSEPVEVSVELVAPRSWRASMHEPPIDGDPDTTISPSAAVMPFHAYSASGEVTAPAIYAGDGEAADYDWLSRQGIDVRGRIVLVRHSGAQRYRGAAVWTAEQRGAAGVLMYPERPAGDALSGQHSAANGARAVSAIERGSVAYDFLVPGDPSTPGWPSLPGAKRIERQQAISLPKIPSVPLSVDDVRPILESLGGPAVPERMRSHLVASMRAGAGPAVVRMKAQLVERSRSVWTVTGLLRGASADGEVVVVGNHRDAWVYGGVDPSTGSAALIELARAFGELRRGGWRPKRNVLFASWDAEEMALISSTEWGEQHEGWLRDRAIAYLNVDSAASGSRFVAGAVPSLLRVIAGAADAVGDPLGRVSVATAARSQWSADRGAPAQGRDNEVVFDRLGGGSDYAVFLNHLGVPAADLAFDGPLTVYHSVYDTHRFVAEVADPEFRYTTALVKVWGIAALRLMEADAIPLDIQAAAAAIANDIGEMDRQLTGSSRGALDAARQAAAALERAAASFTAARDQAIATADMKHLAASNRRAMAVERAFTDPAGLRGRPWYRHLLHAPDRSYAPRVLPGIADAIDARDPDALAAEARRLTEALRRATALLQ